MTPFINSHKESDVNDSDDITAKCLQFNTGERSNAAVRYGQRNGNKCVYCKKDHFSHKCSTVTDIRARHTKRGGVSFVLLQSIDGPSHRIRKVF